MPVNDGEARLEDLEMNIPLIAIIAHLPQNSIAPSTMQEGEVVVFCAPERETCGPSSSSCQARRGRVSGSDSSKVPASWSIDDSAGAVNMHKCTSARKVDEVEERESGESISNPGGGSVSSTACRGRWAPKARRVS